MTVTYSSEVTTSTGVGIFLKLLARWKGSIYKIVWMDLLLYLATYYCLNLLYIYGLTEQYGRRQFINIVTYFSKYGNSIPLSFVLGFYVNVVYTRWWAQYSSIPYPDNIAILIGTSIHGKDEKSRIIRRTIIRYVCVAFTLTLTMISPKAKKRFPTLHHFVQAGLLSHEEKGFIEELNKDCPTYYSKLPLAWAANIATKARSEGLIKEELSLRDILEQINAFREKCKQLWDYDWICVPLVYTQVVTLAVYLYFLFTVIGTQFIEEQTEGDTLIFSFPLMSCVEFFFYMGWLKVAESLINPFGEDDDDFEVVWMIDRHLQVGYLLVDKLHNEHPKLAKDYHWDQTAPSQLPFTVASQRYMNEHPVESTFKINVQKGDQDLIFRDDMANLEEPGLLVNSHGRSGFKKFFSRRKSDPGYLLKRVAIQDGHAPEAGNDWHELNTLEAETNASGSREQISDEEQFNSLRNSRLENRRETILKLLELLKDDKNEVRRILTEIIK
ncbi:bestrophin-4 isoform X2 [Dendroctonus ponderosae]|uniref:bestrophin-4 isoform X2 n=1 Tax=Dendroctonus ponderosae TaxID=77166 RepID=UPI00203556F7|nr:bestrophin-4 isoform X2 [Dendroctonus ponderosae]